MIRIYKLWYLNTVSFLAKYKSVTVKTQSMVKHAEHAWLIGDLLRILNDVLLTSWSITDSITCPQQCTPNYSEKYGISPLIELCSAAKWDSCIENPSSVVAVASDMHHWQFQKIELSLKSIYIQFRQIPNKLNHARINRQAPDWLPKKSSTC